MNTLTPTCDSREQLTAPNGVVSSDLLPSPVLTGHVGTNADLFPHILKMYVADGASVAEDF